MQKWKTISCQDNDRHENTPHGNIKSKNKMHHQQICDTMHFDKKTFILRLKGMNCQKGQKRHCKVNLSTKRKTDEMS